MRAAVLALLLASGCGPPAAEQAWREFCAGRDTTVRAEFCADLAPGGLPPKVFMLRSIFLQLGLKSRGRQADKKGMNGGGNTMVSVSVRIQGTPDMQPGAAVGRMGSRLLIQYRTKGGEPRERWFDRKRYEVLDGDVASLPRYRRVTQPREQVETNEKGYCTTCGYLIFLSGPKHSHNIRAEES